MLKNPRPPYLGAAYYPELWPPENVAEDIRQMREAGCNLMRIGEFAWISMEPAEGDFQFDWLEKVLDQLHEAGIAVVLGTPTATPPQWLTDKYEETLLQKANGVRLQHGARRHNCPNSPVMRRYNHRIVGEMARRIGRHPALVGWQIDNEVYPYQPCHCPICIEKFQNWLRERYGTIAALNEAWGMDRWSLRYTGFDAIKPPLPDMWNHPTLSARWMEFQGDSWIDFIHDQLEDIRPWSDAPIGTDMMPIVGLNYYKTNASLDVVQFNHYNTFENLHETTMWMDFLRCVKPDVPFWNTETQTCWNGAHSIAFGVRPKGFCRVNSWLPLAFGGEMNLYWLWKCHPAGHELMHGSVVSPSGRFLHMLDEVQRCSEEFEKATDFLARTKVASRAALHASYDAWLSFSYAPIKQNFKYWESLFKTFYQPLTFGHHVQLDVIDTPASLEKYDVLFSPYLPTVNEGGLPEKIRTFMENGGTWVVGPMSDIFDRDIRRYTEKPFSLLEDWGQIICKYQLPDDNNAYAVSWQDGEKLTGSICYDGLEPRGAQVLATYDDGPLKGLAAVTRTPIGKGSLVVLGTVPEGEAFAKLLSLLPLLPAAKASDNVLTIPRKGEDTEGLMVLEVFNRPGTLELTGEYVNLLNGQICSGKVEIAPADVLVLVKK